MVIVITQLRINCQYYIRMYICTCMYIYVCVLYLKKRNIFDNFNIFDIWQETQDMRRNRELCSFFIYIFITQYLMHANNETFSPAPST